MAAGQVPEQKMPQDGTPEGRTPEKRTQAQEAVRNAGRLAIRVLPVVALVAVGFLQVRSCYAPMPPQNKVRLASKETTYHATGVPCAPCHQMEAVRWSGTLHAASAKDVLLNKEHNTAEQLTSECIGCHAPFQAHDTTIADLVGPLNQKGPWTLRVAAVKWQAIKCEACHRPESLRPGKLSFYDAAKGRYTPVANVTTLCEKCHQVGTEDSRDLAGSVHQGLECTACHLRGGMNMSPKEACKTCHPKVDPWGHPSVATLDTSYRSDKSPHYIHQVTCRSCHFCSGCHQPDGKLKPVRL